MNRHKALQSFLLAIVTATPLLLGPILLRPTAAGSHYALIQVKQYLTLVVIMLLWSILLWIISSEIKRSRMALIVGVGLLLLLMLGAFRTYFGQTFLLILFADFTITLARQRIVNRSPILSIAVSLLSDSMRAILSAIALNLPLSLPLIVVAFAFGANSSATRASKLAKEFSLLTGADAGDKDLLGKSVPLLSWAAAIFVALLIYSGNLHPKYLLVLVPPVLAVRFGSRALIGEYRTAIVASISLLFVGIIAILSAWI